MPAHEYAQPATWNANDRALRMVWEQSPEGMASARRRAWIEARVSTYEREEVRGQHERVLAAMADIAPIIDRLAWDTGVGREFGFSIRDRLTAIDTSAAKRRATARAEAEADAIDFTVHKEAAE